MKEYGARIRLSESEVESILRQRAQAGHNNVLAIGDLHTPFEKKGYLEHCIAIAKKYDVQKVVFIGDLVDNHYSSYHETDPDGFSAGEELDRAIARIQKWYTAFPEAEVMVGNHDRIIVRKAFSNGIAKRWIKDYKDVLETPNWEYKLSTEYDNVLYLHGEGGGGINGALQKALNKRRSIVQGHFHTESHIRWNASSEDLLFGMQVGCGIDDDAYALAYAQFNAKKSIVSCGVVTENGRLPILEPMKL